MIGFSVALWPQVQTGCRGGQMQSRDSRCNVLLNDAVFERVVANDHKAKPKAEQTVSPRQRLNQAG